MFKSPTRETNPTETFAAIVQGWRNKLQTSYIIYIKFQNQRQLILLEPLKLKKHTNIH